jgi:hypothetical protein
LGVFLAHVVRIWLSCGTSQTTEVKWVLDGKLSSWVHWLAGVRVAPEMNEMLSSVNDRGPLVAQLGQPTIAPGSGSGEMLSSEPGAVACATRSIGPCVVHDAGRVKSKLVSDELAAALAML